MRPTALLLLGLLAPPATAQAPTHPATHLGRPVGVDFELVDWGETSSYYLRLARESARVQVEKVGETTEGRDYLLAVISGEENLGRIDEIQANTARLADPRGLSSAERERLLSETPVVLFISNGMHSTETAATQFGMELAWELATSEAEPYASARENVVVVMTPNTNPDGLDLVTGWYRETVGTEHEGTGTLELYQHYSGHDNNRDWFMLSQAETRIVTEQLYSVWHPQVYWDVHQQGQSRERFFVPPFRDPLNPNLDSGVIAGIDALGSRALFDMTGAGFTGISTGVTYDMWWNGGNRNVPVRHNIVGLLTEAASVQLASPVFLSPSELQAPRGLGSYAPSNKFPAPWPGGWWRLRDIIDYELGFARSLLGSLAREPRLWLANALAASERAISAAEDGAPRAWLIPTAGNADVGAVGRLVDSLTLAGVEIAVAEEDFEADGRSWSAGSLLISRRQPYGQHVKDLFEVQRYPDGDAPYDVAGWTLPFLLGVRRVELMQEPDVRSRMVSEVHEALSGFGADVSPGSADGRDSRSWTRVFRALAAGDSVGFGVEGERAGWFSLPAGGTEGERRLDALPRVGLYTPWSGSMDEGWLRWVLDTFELPYVRVRNETLRAGQLADVLDVLLLPSVSSSQLDRGRSPGSVMEQYTRGLDPEGAVAIEEFVRRGGRLVATGSSAAWVIELLDLPLEDVTRGEAAGEFSCPGSVLRTIPAQDVQTAGLPESVAVFFSRSSAWRVLEREGAAAAPEVLLRYAPRRALLSGWVRAPEVIADQAAWVRAAHGEGEVHLFGFRPQYRSWSQAAFHLLFRALLLPGS